MADKYKWISPYAYCAWSPIKMVDPEGEEPRLFFHGRRSIYSFVKIINAGLGNQFQTKLTRNSDGSYSLGINSVQGGGDIDKLNPQQRAFYDELMACINAKRKDNEKLTYYIDVYYGVDNVMIGNYNNNAIDVADIEQFNSMGESGVTSQGKLIHEMVEQCQKAFYGNKKGESMGRDICHKYACMSESKVNGLRRDIQGDAKIKRGVFKERHIEANGKEHIITIQDRPIIQVTQ